MTLSSASSGESECRFLSLLLFVGAQNQAETAELSHSGGHGGLFLMVLVLFKALPAGMSKRSRLLSHWNCTHRPQLFLFHFVFFFLSHHPRVCLCLCTSVSMTVSECVVVHVTKTHRIRKLCGVGGVPNTCVCVNCRVADHGSADKCSKMALFNRF